ncbi:MAG: hypothetical protein DYG89_01890 [Caldilinea sp. CFX5]|nr:hypothetical protein [Caldilinea sp. CFX5]
MAKVVAAHQWSMAWNRLLERLGLLTRAAAGNGRQRARIKRIEVLIGRVQAEVQEPGNGACQVTIKFGPLTERTWLQLLALLENQLQSSGQRNVEELFREPAPFFTELSNLLLPTQPDAVAVACSCCPAGQRTCPTCELVYRQVGILLDEEPILLLRLRGREWQALQQALQARRKTDYLGGTAGATHQSGNGSQPTTPPGTTATTESLERTLDHFWGSRKALDALHYHIAPPAIEFALLRRLGPLPGLLDEPAGRTIDAQELGQAMTQIYRRVTTAAQALAYSLDPPTAANGERNEPGGEAQ